MKYPVRNLLLEIAIKRVLNTRMMVVRQRQRIERLRNLGCTTHRAEQTLQELEKSLAIFETHERELKERLHIRQSARSNFQDSRLLFHRGLQSLIEGVLANRLILDRSESGRAPGSFA
jgi:hypothetical protein